MIVIAIIGVLAAIAIPAYKNYTIRAHTSEIIHVMAKDKTSLAEHWAVKQRYTGLETMVEVGIPATARGQYIDSTTISTEAATKTITLTYTIDLAALFGGTGTATLALQGTGTKDGIRFVCGLSDASSFPVRYLPSTCRTRGL